MSNNLKKGKVFENKYATSDFLFPEMQEAENGDEILECGNAFISVNCDSMLLSTNKQNSMKLNNWVSGEYNCRLEKTADNNYMLVRKEPKKRGKYVLWNYKAGNAFAEAYSGGAVKCGLNIPLDQYLFADLQLLWFQFMTGVLDGRAIIEQEFGSETYRELQKKYVEQLVLKFDTPA